MPTSRASSTGSAACRRKSDARAAALPAALAWRPSRLLAALLCGFGVLAAIAVLASDLQRPWSWIVAAAALGEGLRLARRHLRLRPRGLRWDPGGVVLDGVVLHAPQLSSRGPLAVLRWRDRHGRIQRLAWWPDTLPAASRRELRLAAAVAATHGGRASVAP